MLKEIVIITNIAAFILFLYGAFDNFLNQIPNSCEMTYMFRNPQFKKIHVSNNKFFSNYGLYYYYEGSLGIDIKNLNGAPVLFVPGNGGSYKQVRSLASVSLQKALQQKNQIHLDYFTIDFAEELSAFYGGYLEQQKRFLQLCIRKIVRIYKRRSDETVKMVIIGHSMGGIIAGSVLDIDDFMENILSIIFLSTPLERPVVNFDFKITKFYENTNKMLQEKRGLIDETTDLYGAERGYPKIEDVLLISIGGGVRDLQVPAWLTTSQFSNIHSMTSAIPTVWLSCDHLSIVWCLQLMKVVNRFLYSILVRKPENYVVYQQDFGKNIQSAYKHFIGVERGGQRSNEIEFVAEQNNTIWHIETSHRDYKTFSNGIQKTFMQLMPLKRNSHEEKMYIEILHTEMSDIWLFGCILLEEKSSEITCKKVFSLSHYISDLPNEEQRKSYALIDVQKIIRTYPDWTHILVRLAATKRTASLFLDIYNPKERLVELEAVQWHNFTEESVASTSPEGAAYMQFLIKNISLSYLALELHLEKIDCSETQTDIIIKTSASWASGFDEYHIFPVTDQEKRIVINVPIEIAPTIDNSLNHVYVDMHLAPSCRLMISQNLSLQHTLKRIVQRFTSTLPAHLVAVLIVVLSQHCTSTELTNENIYKTAAKEFMQLKSMFIVIGVRLLENFIPNGLVPINATPFFVTILLHGTATVFGIFIAITFCLLLKLFGSVLRLIMSRLSVYLPSILTARVTLGIIILAISLATCCGLGLLLAFLLYFLWLSNESKVALMKRISSAEKTEEGFELMPLEHRKNFVIHLQLLQLLFVLTCLNGIETLAFVIKYPNSSPDRQWLSNILTLICWLFLWETKDFTYVFNKKTVSLCLYGIAISCMVYGQEFMYSLNYSIAFVFINLLIVASFCKIWQFYRCYSNTKTIE